MLKTLPTTAKEVEMLEWKYLDVIIFTGDAYIDHPSFGAAVIGRYLFAHGYKVAIVPQPNWRDDLRDFKKLGKPNLFFGVTAGNMDSMLNHYTTNRRLRSNDAYTPGDKIGMRPDFPTIVYAKILKTLFPETPIIIGGIEASLRRLTHYDYIKDNLQKSILADSQADILVYGMGEKTVLNIATALQKNKDISRLHDIPQIAYITTDKKILLEDKKTETIELHSYEECLKSKHKFAENFTVIETESNQYNAKRLIESVDNKYIVINPPHKPLTESEIDEIYNLPFSRRPHPKYKEKITAYEMIKNSITIHRGCFGGCSFCTISAHQGKFIASRSEKSISDEITQITAEEDFKGHITDLGGPSANMYKMTAHNFDICKKCKRQSCIYPNICKNMNTSHKPLLQLYQMVRKIPKLKNITIGSGIRYDLLLATDTDLSRQQYLTELLMHHVSGRLKVAPEHSAERVLKIMRKPTFQQFKNFKTIFDKIVVQKKLNLQLIPYFISSHPLCNIEDMAELAAETKLLNYRLEQIQDFNPTPMTLSAAIYYCGFDPYSKEKVFVAHSLEQKNKQRNFFFWYQNENKSEIIRELRKINRTDLINKLYGKYNT